MDTEQLLARFPALPSTDRKGLASRPVLFLLVLLFSYTGISYLDRLYGKDPGALVYLNILTEMAAINTGQLYSLAGCEYQVKMERGGAQLYLDGRQSVFVGYPCNGLTLMLLFTVFIVASGGSVRTMLWYLPLGWVGIYLMNVLRIFTLAVVYRYHSSWVDFNHKYVFTLVVYGYVFWLFITWVRKYGSPQGREVGGAT
jgi:exosortase family protein XrtF